MMPSQRPATVRSQNLSRRGLLAGAAGAGLVAAGGSLRGFDEAVAAAPAYSGVFGYGVASGDPTADAVVIWTRATPPPGPGEPAATPGSGLGRPLEVRWEVAVDEEFRDVVRRGRITTTAHRDHTVKVDVRGLRTYTRYWYRFQAAGATSPVGRTRTAPDEPGTLHALRLALVSCSNYTSGYFGAYASIGKRDDLDFVLHVGDYLYEYGNGEDRYGPDSLVGVRDSEPATETIDLLGYRLRHALHKADDDLRLAHRQHPWITIFDDHEVTNNTWDSGAENHNVESDGDFPGRRRAAYRAYLEWMPFRLPDQRFVPHQGTRFFKRFTFGPLGDLSVLETRQNRSRQVDVPGFTKTGGGFIPIGDPAVDGQLADPERHIAEPEQLAWLKDGVSAARPWHLVGNQVILGPVRWPGAVLGAPASLTLINSDQWDGYRQDQQELLEHLGSRSADQGDTVVLTGDIHSSWAIDLVAATDTGPGYRSVGVEFVTPFYESAAARLAGEQVEVVVQATRGATDSVVAANPWVRYLDGVGHGYTLIDVTPERVQADFYLTPAPTTQQPDPRVVPGVLPVLAASWQTLAGSRRVVPAASAIGPRADQPTGRDGRGSGAGLAPGRERR
jgi:alkaline phosphatase D